jgi:predicted amidohydrolase YtcJ
MPISRRDFLKASGGAIATVITGCASPAQIPEQPLTLSKTPSGPADLILHNGNILTVDANDRTAQAVSVSKGTIQKVGLDSEVSPLIGPNTHIINLRGKTVTPGLIDAHNHMLYFGEQLKYRLDIRPPKVMTKMDLLKVLLEATKVKPEGDWIYGAQGFFLYIKDSPTRWELDEASTKHPVYLPHISGQFAVVNSLALKLAGINRFTPDPYGGKIERDEKTKEPTGRLLQYPAEDLVRIKIPKPSPEEYEAAVQYAAGLFLPHGITSVQDVIVYIRRHTKIYEQMAANHTLPVRLYILEYIDSLRKAREMTALHHHSHHPMCTFGGWKLAIDGGGAA